MRKVVDWSSVKPRTVSRAVSQPSSSPDDPACSQPAPAGPPRALAPALGNGSGIGKGGGGAVSIDKNKRLPSDKGKAESKGALGTPKQVQSERRPASKFTDDVEAKEKGTKQPLSAKKGAKVAVSSRTKLSTSAPSDPSSSTISSAITLDLSRPSVASETRASAALASGPDIELKQQQQYPMLPPHAQEIREKSDVLPLLLRPRTPPPSGKAPLHREVGAAVGGGTRPQTAQLLARPDAKSLALPARPQTQEVFSVWSRKKKPTDMDLMDFDLMDFDRQIEVPESPVNNIGASFSPKRGPHLQTSDQLEKVRAQKRINAGLYLYFGCRCCAKYKVKCEPILVIPVYAYNSLSGTLRCG